MCPRKMRHLRKLANIFMKLQKKDETEKYALGLFGNVLPALLIDKIYGREKQIKFSLIPSFQ